MCVCIELWFYLLEIIKNYVKKLEITLMISIDISKLFPLDLIKNKVIFAVNTLDHILTGIRNKYFIR